ncbi:ADP-ribosylglycohydrolase family protein [Aeromicrobium sp. Leaf291]|uniref:ADP-ribosylglycohydrolase family protein n=1 Tax=Aeromicrobium sp. Leaf291 TaxID=1736325 RepID=UPI0009E75FC9|nr:ADP-ribosylglycohydrolase family protein [Aeromicrobium sp. Leaf291]
MTLHLTHAQVDRACGVILGAAAGDALGAGYEFGCTPLSPDEPPQMIGGGLGDFAPGEWTDDTSMTLGVLRVAATGQDLRSDNGLTAVAREFAAWFATSPPDVGINTRAVLRAAGSHPTGEAMTAAARDRHERTGRTGSNGSLMRTSPVALVYLDDPDGLVEAARAVGGLTHPDPEAQDACVLWCLAIRHAVLTGELDLRAGVARLPEDRRDLWSERIDRAESEHSSTFRPNGWSVAALMAAWASIVSTPVPGGDRFACEHLVDALGTAIHVGDDTDTVASIAGALLGARWGLSAVPAEWRRILHGYPGLDSRDLERLAFLAAHRGETGKYGWPLVEHIDYTPLQYGRSALARHPFDDGVWMASATELDRLPDDVDAVVTLCLTGTDQVPDDVEQVTFRLQDLPDPAANPNLDFVIVDAARTVAALRAEGKRVLLHCVASHSRTPTVAIAYALTLGVPLQQALGAVRAPLPCARPNRGFRAALVRLNAVDVLGPDGDITRGLRILNPRPSTNPASTFERTR